jgi:hypothetical protein
MILCFQILNLQNKDSVFSDFELWKKEMKSKRIQGKKKKWKNKFKKKEIKEKEKRIRRRKWEE